MSSETSKDRINIHKRPSLIPKRKTNRNTVATKDYIPNSENNSKKNKPIIITDKGKQKEPTQKVTSGKDIQQESFHQLLAKLKREYLDADLEKNSSKEDEASASDPPVVQLPPPTEEFYDRSFLEFVSTIIQNHQISLEEDNDLRNETYAKEKKAVKNDDEKKVEKSRKETEKIDPFPQMSHMEKEEQLVDVNLEFDSIVFENFEENLFDMDNITIRNLKANDEGFSSELVKDNSKNKNNGDKEDITTMSNNNSWLCFDSEGEFVTFKDKDADAFLGMEKILTEGGYMSPINTEKEKKITERFNQQKSRKVNDNIASKDYNNGSPSESRYLSSNSSINIEKYLVGTSTPNELLDKDTKDTEKKRDEFFGTYKRKYAEVEKQEYILRSPSLFRFPP
ncbi:hypothetical protein BD770DRAFT_440098 [Pilaira anomala]|nr:hypothetical protein BD770DRAFT_440098 [Pilaira anomala]